MAATKPAETAPAAPDPDGCHNCRFWLQRTHAGANQNLGACRRYPPTTPGYQGVDHASTSRKTWCGEHSAADPTA